MSEIPFETLKERAKKALDTRIAQCDPIFDTDYFDYGNACRLQVSYITLTDEERAALKTLSQGCFNGTVLDQQGQNEANAGRPDRSQWTLFVRRVGYRVIDHWDVRCVALLIELFPECVMYWELRQRTAATCFLDDTGTWIVSFPEHPVTPQSP